MDRYIPLVVTHYNHFMLYAIRDDFQDTPCWWFVISKDLVGLSIMLFLHSLSKDLVGLSIMLSVTLSLCRVDAC